MTVSPTVIFTTIQNAVVTALTNAGITAYPYESRMLDQVPCATLSMTPPHAAVDTGTYNNSTYSIGLVTWTLRYYVDLEEGDDGTAQANLQAGIAKIYEALGADRTLGHACRYSELGDGRVDIVTTGGVATPERVELMFEAPFTATPHPQA
jgi:hypothetical protein